MNYSETEEWSISMHLRRARGVVFADWLGGFMGHFRVALPCLTVGAFLAAVVCGGSGAKAQDKLPVRSPTKLEDNAQPIDGTDRQNFLLDVAHAVIRLDADGDRTMDAIENSQITLTLDSVPDSSRLAVVCNSGGKALNVFVQSLAGELSLNGKVSNAVCTGSGRDDDPFAIKFRLHYESGRTSLFSEQPPQLTFIAEKPSEDGREGTTAVSDDAEDSAQPVILNPRRTQTGHAVVQLPQGWTPVKLPDPIHTDSAFGTFDSSVTFADGTLTVDRKLVLKREKVEVAEMAAFRQWTESIDGGVDVALRSTMFYPDRDASAGTEEQKKAAGLIDAAFREIQAREFGKAEAALNQAEAIDPGHEILHENRGELAAAHGNNVTALAEYRKELESFPNALFEMGRIAEAQLKLGDRDGAIVTLQRWMLADPNSNFAAIHLMELYHKMGRDDLAVSVGDGAMNTMTRDAKRGVDFLMLYGHEQMLTGQTRNAESTLNSVLDLTVDDGIVNDAAYFLSEQGLSLDRAEQTVREALTEFDPGNTASGASTFYADSDPERTSLLLSTWDTLGWILYREGKVRQAEDYVRAAWRSKHDIAISRHLGEILTAEEKPVEAMDVYTLGLASVEGSDAASLSKDPDAIAVRAAMAQLKQKGIAATVTDAKAALLALRTLNLGAAAKPHAAEPYTVTLTASAISRLDSEGDEVEERHVSVDGKVLAGFFPAGSEAALTRKGTIECGKTCSLVFAP